MGLDEVKKEILAKAEAEAEDILQQAKKEVDGFISEAREKCKQIANKNQEETRKLLDNLEKKELAKGKFEVKKIIFNIKKNLIKSAFDSARDSLINMNPKKNEKLLKSLLKKGKNEINPKYVYTNENDKKHFNGFEWKKADITGGVILENKDKSIRIDYSYDSLLEAVKENHLQDVAKQLFNHK